jgi:hypothetical protein
MFFADILQEMTDSLLRRRLWSHMAALFFRLQFDANSGLERSPLSGQSIN